MRLKICLRECCALPRGARSGTWNRYYFRTPPVCQLPRTSRFGAKILQFKRAIKRTIICISSEECSFRNAPASVATSFIGTGERARSQPMRRVYFCITAHRQSHQFAREFTVLRRASFITLAVGRCKRNIAWDSKGLGPAHRSDFFPSCFGHTCVVSVGAGSRQVASCKQQTVYVFTLRKI